MQATTEIVAGVAPGVSSDEVLIAPQHFMDQYRDKVIVAPMVRVCTLPFRLLAIDMGADLVYSEETIDWKILRSKQRFNESLGTTEFIDRNDGTVFFRTCERERSKLVVQIGTSDPSRALKVAKLLEPYVAGIDVNCGCPKEFSLKGGMGAALLTQPVKIRQILTTLVKGLEIPVTCKIRILPNIDDTINLCRLIENCGVAAVAVHGRTKYERPQHSNHADVIAEISSVLKIPVIANGGSKEISCFSDIKKFCDKTGTGSSMIARAVMWNCSILRAGGFLPLDEVIRRYIVYCIEYDNPFTYTKYTVQNMLRGLQDSPRGKAFLETQTLREIAIIWELGSQYDAALAIQQKKNQQSTKIEDILTQRRWAYQSRDEIDVNKIVDEDTGNLKVITMPLLFIRGNFCNADLPKMVLNRYVNENNLLDPVFSAEFRDRFFIGTVEIEGISYKSNWIEKSRRYAEQAAAMVYLHYKKIVDHNYGFVANEGSRRYQHLSQLTEKTPRIERQLQQALKSHLGKNRRRQRPAQQRDFEASSTEVYNDSSKENDVEHNSKTEASPQRKKSFSEDDCMCSKSKTREGKRELGDCPSTSSDKNKKFIKIVDEENLSIDTDAINLNQTSQVLRAFEKDSTR